MNLRLWFRLFLIQFICLLSITVIIFIVFIYGMNLVSIEVLFSYHLIEIPFYLILLSLLLTMSLIFSIFFTVILTEPFDQLRARLNWLLLGKYNHPIFKQEINGSDWYDSATQTLKDIDKLREKLIQLSSDLQEFTAAPVFVGEDTKEEIIEQERKRIARELHDSVSQQLFAATMMISAISEISEKNDLAISHQIKQIENTIGNAQTEMRALLLHLRPIALADQRLEQGIENLLKELDTKIPIKIVRHLSRTKLESGIEDHLFRIIQEAISNTMRHSKANKLDVYLNQDINTVQLKIVDDGVGFNVKEGMQKGNYGIRNMNERVLSLGGSFNIVSMPGKGTTIDIRIPITIKEGIK